MRSPAPIRSLRRRLDLQAQDGFGIIEVLVSALLVVMVSLAVFAALDAAGRTASSNKSRSVASSLAQTDQERLRGLKISDIAGTNTTTPSAPIDGRIYQVQSRAEYVVGTAGSSDCSSAEEAPRYLKITSTVTWQGMRGIRPVEADSLRAMPSRSTSGLGSLAIDINAANGTTGQAGVSVSIAGPQNLSGVTNANGCVIFGFIPAGSYTISATKGGHVRSTLPNAPTIADSATVSADAIASKSYLYDKPGAAKVTYQTSNSFGGTTTANAPGDAFTVANARLGSLVSTKTLTHTPPVTGTYTSGKLLFPFTDAYQVWAGCAENKPPPTVPTVTIPVDGTNVTAVNIRKPRFRVTVRQYTAATGTANAVVNGARVVIKPTSARCVNTVDNGTTNSSGNRDTILAYGRWDVCIQNKSTNPTAVLTATGVDNNVANGTTAAGIPILPYRATTAPTETACTTTPAG